MATVFFVEGRVRSQPWRMSDYFASNRTYIGVVERESGKELNEIEGLQDNAVAV